MDPHVADVREENVSIPYDVITSIKLEEAPYFTLAIKLESPTLANAVGLGMIHGLVGEKIAMKGLLIQSLERRLKN